MREGRGGGRGRREDSECGEKWERKNMCGKRWGVGRGYV